MSDEPDPARTTGTFGSRIASDALEDAVNDGPFGLVITDAHGVIQWVNVTLTHWLALRATELTGRRTFQELLAPGGRIYYDTHVRPLLHLQHQVSEIALELVRSDGSRMPAFVNSRLRRDQTTGQQMVDIVVFDATLRRSYDTELLAERRLAEQSETLLQVMYSIASGLGGAISMDDIVAVVADRGSATISGASCAIWMFGDAGRSVVRVGGGRDAGHSRLEITVPQSAPALDRLAAGELVVIADRVTMHDEYPLLSKWMGATGVDSALIAPLMVDGALEGAISYGFATAHEFDSAELRAVTALATQTEQALRRARLVSAQLRSQERLEALLEFTDQLSGALTLDDVVDAMVDGSQRLLGAIGVRVALLDDTGQQVDFVRGLGIGGRVGLRIPIESNSIGCTAIRTGEMQSVEDRQALQERFPDSPILSEPEFGRVVAAQLRRGEQVLGGWVLAFSDEGPADLEDMKLIELFAAQAGQATQRAALHDAAHSARMYADLRRLMSEALNRAVTTAEVGRVVTGEGRRAFDAAGLALFVVDLHNPLVLVAEAVSGLDGVTVAASASIGDVTVSADLPGWAPLRFVTGHSAVVAALAGLLDGVGWEAAVLMPLGLFGRAIGLTVVGFDRLDALSSATRAALSSFSAEASVAIGRARRFDVDHDIAITLQRSLLPVVQPLHDCWAVSTWYQPGSELLEVGGDLFDVTELDDGRIVLVVGDVVGHGLDAAASMGFLRSAAKALVLVRSRPADVIAGLHAFAAVTPGVLYSSICCIAVAPDGTAHYACAGHPFPILRHEDGRIEPLEGGRSTLLGIVGAPATQAEFQLTDGATLIVYTDGLIERHGASSVSEMSRLSGYLADAVFPTTAARDVVEQMLLDQPTQDDIVVVCLTKTPVISPAQ